MMIRAVLDFFQAVVDFGYRILMQRDIRKADDGIHRGTDIETYWRGTRFLLCWRLAPGLLMNLVAGIIPYKSSMDKSKMRGDWLVNQNHCHINQKSRRGCLPKTGRLPGGIRL